MRVRQVDDEYAKLAAWLGEDEETLRARLEGNQPKARLLAWSGGDVAGMLTAWLRPDGLTGLYFAKCRSETCAALLDAYGGLSETCVCVVDVEDETAAGALRSVGFTEDRGEFNYEIPVRWIDTQPPAGLRVITGDRTELTPLMMLDVELREDIPGSAGWQPDPERFRAETYDSPQYNPRTYIVAVDEATDEYIGLARVWMSATPRLGMVGVREAYRRKGLARVLVGRAFDTLIELGVPLVVAEVDTGNVASNALMANLGARVTGQSIEMRRDA